MNNLSLKFKVIATVVMLGLSSTFVYVAFAKDGAQTEVKSVNASEVNFEGIDQQYKILIYQNDELKFSGSGSEKMNIPPGEYELIVVDTANEDKKESQDLSVPNADKVNVNLGEMKKKLDASPTPQPTIASGEVKFIDPLSKCDGYRLSRGVSGWHTGIDLVKPNGCVIVAAAEGKVIAAGWGEHGQGFHVKIKHANGFESYYYHGNGEFMVKEGDEVKPGDEIMFMGSTGNATGTHLHFEIRKNDHVVDPENYVKFKI